MSARAEGPLPSREPAETLPRFSPEGRMPRADLSPPRRVVRCPAGRWLAGLGIALLVLLPLLTLLLAVNQRQAWLPLAGELLLPAGEGKTEMLDLLSYLLLSLGAVLLSALPGLSAWGLGRLLIRLTPPELKRD